MATEVSIVAGSCGVRPKRSFWRRPMAAREMAMPGEAAGYETMTTSLRTRRRMETGGAPRARRMPNSVRR